MVEHVHEAYDKFAANAFKKAKKNNAMVRYLPVCFGVNIHQHDHFTNGLNNTNFITADCTPSSSCVISGIPIQWPIIDDDEALYTLTVGIVYVCMMPLIVFSLGYVCFQLLLCCWRCMRPRRKRVERVMTPDGLH
jgi:hypothetical protein